MSSSYLISACSGSYTLDSNVSKARWDDYFKAGEVELYQSEQLEQLPFKRLGLISGDSCQANVDLPPPDMGQARTAAKRQAADLGANGIRDLRCVYDSEAQPGCLASISCFGEAIQVSANGK